MIRRPTTFTGLASSFSAIALALALLPAGPVHAQPTHKLDDQGNFVPQAEPDPSTPEGQLELIRRTLVQDQAKQAEKQADAWIEENPLHPLLVEAYLIRGDAIAAQGDYYRSLADYELIARAYPGTEQYRTAIERQYDIAKLFTGGLKRKSKWFGIRMFPADDEGVELLIRVQERLPGTELGERASMSIGDYYFDKGDMEMASEAYDLFLLNYPTSRQREWAMLRLIQASLAKYKGPQFDPSGLFDAAQRLREYTRDYPAAADKIGAEALMVRINEQLAQKKLVTAQWYDQRGLERGAITMYRRVIQDYPQSAAAIEALQWLEDNDIPLVDPRDPTSTRGATAEGDADVPSIESEGGDEK